jgi:hypothetical protein
MLGKNIGKCLWVNGFVARLNLICHNLVLLLQLQLAPGLHMGLDTIKPRTTQDALVGDTLYYANGQE